MKKINNIQKHQIAVKRQKSNWPTLAWWTSLSGIMTAIGTLVAVISLVMTIVIPLSILNKDSTPMPTPQPNIGLQPTPTPTPQPDMLQRTPWLGLEFWQHDVQDGMTDESAPQSGSRPAIIYVTLESAPFEIRFPTLPTRFGMEICASTDDKALSLNAGGLICKANTK